MSEPSNMKTSDRKRRVSVVLVDRANYGRMKPVMAAIAAHPALELKTIVSGSMLLDRFGRTVRQVERDGFPLDAEIHVELEGSVPVTMAKSVGFATIEFASALNMIRPDIVLIIGDRYEAFAAAIAASYMNIPVAHIQGGESSGSIDESTRHAITKFAQYHFPSTARAADYVVRMGESPGTVFNVGCPSGDIVRNLDRKLPDDVFRSGVGGAIDPSKPYALVLFHPVTTRFGAEESEVDILISAVAALRLPTVWLWPNIDAGSDNISKALRRYRERHNDDWIHFIKGFPPETFLAVLANAVIAIGNSSSFVRDSSFLGTPVVLVGDRQRNRERAENVIDVPVEFDAIVNAGHRHLAHGNYQPSTLYGDGNAAARIADTLANVGLYVQKGLDYTDIDSERPALHMRRRGAGH
jgi:UDP-hydrolysing UDP-N-acetyl-D-glucosamine 2-epimerase